MRWSDDNGYSWTSPTNRVINDDGGTNSQFFPQLAVDPMSGSVGVCWYDCRNDPQNVRTQIYGSISRNGGTNWSTNFRLNPGTNDATQLTLWTSFGYGDYTGIDYHNGFLQFIWADNSGNPSGNADAPGAMDLYSGRLGY